MNSCSGSEPWGQHHKYSQWYCLVLLLLLLLLHTTINQHLRFTGYFPSKPQIESKLSKAKCELFPGKVKIKVNKNESLLFQKLKRSYFIIEYKIHHQPFTVLRSQIFPEISTIMNRHTHTHPFNGPLSGTTRVSWYQKGKPIWILLKQETASGSGIHWDICKSAPRSSQITMPVPHHSIFYRPDALPAAQPTASKHSRISIINRQFTKNTQSS